MAKSKHSKRKHFKNRNYHHNIAKIRGGGSAKSNLILLDIDFHTQLHAMFGNRTIKEIIKVLQRLDRAKKAQTT